MFGEFRIYLRDLLRRWRGAPYSKYSSFGDLVRWQIKMRSFRRATKAMKGADRGKAADQTPQDA